MKFFRFLKKNNKKKQRGVALIFALGILGLMVVLALTFASLSFSDQVISRGSSEQEAAKIMAKSAVNRVIALLENNPAIVDTNQIVSGGDPNNANHFDHLWKMITFHGDVPGAGEMKEEVEKRLKNGTNTPYWQYVLAPNKDGKDEIVGRFAYMAYQPVGLLDPYITAKNSSEATSPVDRYGMTMDEVDLKALENVSVSGSSGRLLAADINKLGENNANNSVPSDISTPSALFERFTADTKTKLEKEPAYAGLRDKLTSAWFSVPRSPAHPDRYLYKNGAGAETYYHRFNINRTPEEWKALSVDKLMAKTPTDDMKVYDENGTKNANMAVAIPWFKKDDDATRQIAANFLAYFAPIPDSVAGDTSMKLWNVASNEAVYTANMRTPYLNELMLKIKLNMLVTDEIEGDEKDVEFYKIFTVEITPEIDVYLELTDLYAKSLSKTSSLTFDMNLLKTWKAAATAMSDVTYTNTDFLAGATAFKNYKFTVNDPADNKYVDNANSNVFPVFASTITSTKSYTAKIRVKMVRPPKGDGSYGDPECAKVNFSEPLQQFVMDKISVLMSAKLDGKSTEIPIDLAKITSAETAMPILGQKISDRLDFTTLEPFKLDITTAGGYENNAQKDQERVVVLRYRAIDSAANLNPEHWVKSAPSVFNSNTDAAAETAKIGLNNYAELKADGLLSYTKNNDLVYDKLTVKIDGSTTKEFLVDKEQDHSNVNALTGYGAVVSTSFIRGKAADTTKIQSPWEIGFIHRGVPYQTLNIKQFNDSATEIGDYEKGDANIFDYLKVVQREDDNSVLDENKIHTRGLVNLQRVSRQGGSTDNDGNLPAARAFFSNIDLGWKIDFSNDKFTIPAAASNWSDNLEYAKKIVKELASVVDKPDYILKSRAAILSPAHSELRKVLTLDPSIDSNYSTKTDAEKEELIGRFIMLTTADTTKVNKFSDFLVVTAIAQRIQINAVAQVPDKDWLRDGTFTKPSFSGKPSNADQEAAWIEAGFGYRYVKNGTPAFWHFNGAQANIHPDGSDLSAGDTRLKKFYPGYDKILSTQKVIAWLRKNSNGKWYIERLDYVD
ncbi:MAG: hypothetical protein E7040_04075 [Lentisphaerae bacterium]|nr:hypothetical protein [Lentisphaerota bacterium]